MGLSMAPTQELWARRAESPRVINIYDGTPPTSTYIGMHELVLIPSDFRILCKNLEAQGHVSGRLFTSASSEKQIPNNYIDLGAVRFPSPNFAVMRRLFRLGVRRTQLD